MKFDDKTITGLTIEAGKTERIEFDDDLPGFGVRLRAGGSRKWIVQYRVGKQQRRKTLGTVSEAMNVAKARNAAAKDLATVTLGGDPQAHKVEQRAKSAETFDHYVKLFLAAKKETARPRHYSGLETFMTKHWSPFNSRSVHAIAMRDVAARLTAIASERGPVAANRAQTALGSFFAWLIGEGVTAVNPVIGVNKKGAEKPRDRVLSDEELAYVWRACRDDDHGRIVKLLILTAARRDEIGGLVKSELDLPGRKATLSGERTKNHREHELPLSDLAVTIIKEAIEGREASAGFGDAAKAHGEDVKGFSGWSRAKAALDKRIAQARAKAGLEPMAAWTVHDLRRTADTRMHDLGVLPHVVEAVLNHVSGHKAGVAGRYNKATYAAEKRQALDMWAAHVAAIVAGKPASNVVSLRA
jgi:integrase